MNDTETISLSVDRETARFYREADAERKARYARLLSEAVRREAAAQLQPYGSLVEAMDASSAEAARNGFDAAAYEEFQQWMDESL